MAKKDVEWVKLSGGGICHPDNAAFFEKSARDNRQFQKDKAVETPFFWRIQCQDTPNYQHTGYAKTLAAAKKAANKAAVVNTIRYYSMMIDDGRDMKDWDVTQRRYPNWVHLENYENSNHPDAYCW